MKRTFSFSTLMTIVTGIAILSILLVSARNLSRGNNAKGKDLLESSLRRAATACYAQEGAFPQRLEDLENRYGVQIDHRRYVVLYEVFAPNLMPEITVLERNG